MVVHDHLGQTLLGAQADLTELVDYGNLHEVLDACPNATLVANWFLCERISAERLDVPPTRMRWLNDGETIDVGDQGYDDAPRSIPAGSRLSFDNTSSSELHELVVFRLPDDIDTPLGELVGLPPDQLEATLGAPVTVMFAATGCPRTDHGGR